MSCGGEHVCVNCFDDEGIRNFIERHENSSNCSFCGADTEDTVATSVESVITHIHQCILQDYDLAANILSYVSAEGGYIGEHWDTHDLLVDQVALELPNDNSGILLQAIVDGLGLDSWCHRNPYSPTYTDHVRFSWDYFCQVIKHEKRFFFTSVGNSMDGDVTLSPSQTLEKIFQYARDVDLFVNMPIETRLYRARYQRAGEILTTASQLGPPPEDMATQTNRMSPPGIVMFYASDIPETALRETGSGPGTFVVGEFITRRNATILDFGRLPSIPSLFQEYPDIIEYNPRDVLRFLHHIVYEISQPIERGDRVHVDYIPTQVVTEYIRSQTLYNGERIDGIRFPSAVHEGHFSYVLFATQENLLPIDEDSLDREDRWIELLNTSIHNLP